MQTDITLDVSNSDLHNDVYIPLFKKKERTIILYGGRDSGKSDFVASQIVINMLQQFYYLVVLCRGKMNKIKDSQYAAIRKIIKRWNIEQFFEFTPSRLCISCRVNDNRIIGRGLDRYPEILKSVDDPTCVWYEEADEIPYEAYIKSTLSLRNSYGIPLREYLTLNSDDESCWINKEFFPPKETYERADGLFTEVKSIKSDAVIYHVTYKNNKFVTKDRETKILNTGDADAIRVNAYGLWGNRAKGLVYTNWKLGEVDKHAKFIGYSLDYGYSADPTAFCKIWINKLLGEIYVQELCYEPGYVYTENHLNPDQKNCERLFLDNNITDELIIADQEARAGNQELRNRGFNIYDSIAYPGSVNDGVTLVKKYRIIVVGDSPNLIKELKRYKYDVDKMTGEPNGKIVDKDNHLMDCIRNMIYMDGRLWE